jgi:hypothetical protein
MSKRKQGRGPTPARERWAQPFQLDPRSPLPSGDWLWGNGWWTVHVKYLEEDAGMAGPLWLSIHDRPRSTRHDWREFQRIKNEVCGEEREAVELYPAESRLVDTANEFHLFVLPEGEQAGFGWSNRMVHDGLSALDPEVVAAAAADEGITNPAQLRKARQRAIRERG